MAPSRPHRDGKSKASEKIAIQSGAHHDQTKAKLNKKSKALSKANKKNRELTAENEALKKRLAGP